MVAVKLEAPRVSALSKELPSLNESAALGVSPTPVKTGSIMDRLQQDTQPDSKHNYAAAASISGVGGASRYYVPPVSPVQPPWMDTRGNPGGNPQPAPKPKPSPRPWGEPQPAPAPQPGGEITVRPGDGTTYHIDPTKPGKFTIRGGGLIMQGDGAVTAIEHPPGKIFSALARGMRALENGASNAFSRVGGAIEGILAKAGPVGRMLPKMGRAAGPIVVGAIAAYEAGKEIVTDPVLARGLCKGAGAVAGVLAGGWMGMQAGAIAGSVVPGAGNVVGGVVGFAAGAVASVYGADIGKQLGEALYNHGKDAVQTASKAISDVKSSVAAAASKAAGWVKSWFS